MDSGEQNGRYAPAVNAVRAIEFVSREELKKAWREVERLRRENERLTRELKLVGRGQKRRNPKKLGRKSGEAHEQAVTGLRLRVRRARGEISEHGMWSSAGRLVAQLERVLSMPCEDAAGLRLVKHPRRQQPHLFTYLHCLGVETTNHRAERAIRPVATARKVWRGNGAPRVACL